ncbi:hypothetical protein [Peribacillus simplex]|uniref:hypothetical protein n=1 Tax=Peribacillus simplex TaxID=1478 RepID=UPI003D2BB3E7
MIKKMFKPLTVIPKIKSHFFIWIVLILFFGQLGIIASVFADVGTIVSALHKNFSDGNFYTFSIALLAAGILPFAQEYLYKEEKIRFRGFKMSSMIFGFLLIVIMVIKFTVLPTTSSPIAEIIIQSTLYAISLFISVYFLCLENLERDYESFKDIDDKATKLLQKKTSKSIGVDDRGVQL